jgi:hypothetical protein
MSTAVHITWHGAQINFEDLPPYLTYGLLLLGIGEISSFYTLLDSTYDTGWPATIWTLAPNVTLRQAGALTTKLHSKETPIYVFLFWKLRGLSPNLHFHVSVSDLCISSIGPHISCSRIDRLIVEMYKSLTDPWMWKSGLWTRSSFSGNTCFEFSALVLCSVRPQSSN